MARWRAVPTAVWTAVGALAFLASTGLAVVLGAGLHVWSGPLAPPTSVGPPSASAGRVGGSGVVTVAPPATQQPARPHTTAPGVPAVALPFVPFTSAPAPAAAVDTVAPRQQVQTSTGSAEPVAHPRPNLVRAVLGLPRELRTTLLGGTRLRLAPAKSVEDALLAAARPLPKVHAHSAMHLKGHVHGAVGRHHHSHHHGSRTHGKHGHGHGEAGHGHRHGHHGHHAAGRRERHHHRQD